MLARMSNASSASPQSQSRGRKHQRVRPREHISRATRALRARDYDLARQILRRALRTDPADAKAWALLGEVHWVLGRRRLAVRALRSATRLDPHDASSFMLLGDVLIELDGAAPKAVDALQRATRLDPRMPGVWRLLAQAYEADRRTARAVAAYRRHLLLEGGDTMTRVQLGNALARVGRLAQAGKELRAAASRDPRDPNAVFGLGEVYERAENFQAAERAFRTVVRMCPRDPYPRLKLAEVLDRLGQRDQAAAQARALVRIEPGWRRFVSSFLR